MEGTFAVISSVSTTLIVATGERSSSCSSSHHFIVFYKVAVFEVHRYRHHVVIPCLATQTAIDCLLPIRLSLLPEDSTLTDVVVIVVSADDVVNVVVVVAVKSF